VSIAEYRCGLQLQHVIGSHWSRWVQVDVVVIDWQTRQLLLGECKWGDERESRTLCCSALHKRRERTMPTFLTAEKQRQEKLKPTLFSTDACTPGTYGNPVSKTGTPKPTYPFCLYQSHAAENLHESLRADAISYFAARGIPWHGGHGGNPSNHLCSSQVACVNTLWPLRHDPELLTAVFRPFFPDLVQVLPLLQDDPKPGTAPDGKVGYLAFEWTGTDKYFLQERSWQRGANTTSADFAFRYADAGGAITVVLGEWKYTEDYRSRKIKTGVTNATTRSSGRATKADAKKAAATLAAQQGIYRPHYERWQAAQPGLPDYDSLFVEPFYQLMRLTLLAHEMEQPSDGTPPEMGAQRVVVAHVVPRANTDFARSWTVPALKTLGATVSAAWQQVAPQDRFIPIATEDLLDAISAAPPPPLRPWADYLVQRYGWSRPMSPGAAT
jgi:hypothetical protein